MSQNYNYKGEKYVITFKGLQEKIKVYYKNCYYYSNYTLNQISDKIKKEADKIKKYEDILSLNEKNKLLKSFDIMWCISKNISKNKLTFGLSYTNCLPSIWSIFPEDTDNNKNNSDKDTFQINLYSESRNYKLLLLYFKENNKNEILIDEEKNQKKIKDEIDKIPNDFIISKAINDLNDLDNLNEIANINIQNYIQKVFILNNIEELNDDLIEYIWKEYRNQLFLIIMNTDNNINIRPELEHKLNECFSDEDVKSYFDFNNIIILDKYNKLSLSILKIYLYFNQIDDYDFIDFTIKNKLLEKNIEGLKEELEYITNIEHFINIKVCGNSSFGKSTFINTVLGEKRALTKQSTGTTNKSNIFLSKKYHLKLIDDLGFNEGEEGQVNEEITNLKSKKHRIIIDENIRLSYGYSNDSRNKLHLFLYFYKYKSHYNIIQEHLKYLKKIVEEKVPILFIINFCDNKIFEDKDKLGNEGGRVSIRRNSYLTLLDDIEHQLKETQQNEFINYKKIPLNCLNKKGFSYLFNEIYDIFKDNLIKPELLDAIQKGANYGIPQKNLKEILKENIFFKDIKLEDVISKQMKASVELIRTLILNLTGQYSNSNKNYLSFYFSRVWNNLLLTFGFWRPNNEFYPLLTDLVWKIYDIFGYEKSTEECNEFIKQSIYNYFKIDKEQKISFEKFKNDITNFRNLFNNTKQNFEFINNAQLGLLEERVFEINDNNFTNIGKIFLEQEKKFYDIHITKI